MHLVSKAALFSKKIKVAKGFQMNIYIIDI